MPAPKPLHPATVPPLPHVYWLGGGSGGAKSTVARRLARAHGLTLYDTDGAMADHGKRCDHAACPRLEAFKHMTMDERWLLRDPATMLATFHWFAGEGFDLILEDLRALPPDPPVLVEGFRLLPALTAPAMASPRHGLWLLPTPAFREKAFAARGTLWDIPNRTSNPPAALDNLLQRDDLFTQRLRRETEAHGLAALTVDGQRSEDELVRAVEAHFGLAG